MSQIERTLEEERRIINNVGEGPWKAHGKAEPGPDDQIVIYNEAGGAIALVQSDWIDAVFIAHARTALPLRNAQVAKVLHECGEMEWWAQNCFDVGKDAEGKQWIRAAKAVRRAIEEAGA